MAIPGKLYSQGVGEIQHDRSKTSHHSFGRSIQISSKQYTQSSKEEEEFSRISYASAVGSLMYAMICTRSDLAYIVSIVSRFISNTGKKYWEEVKCVL